MRRSLSSIVLLLALAGVPLSVGCGASTVAPRASSSAARSQTAAARDPRFEALQARANELEGRLALAEVEARDLRMQLREVEAETRRRTVRIGQGRVGADESLHAARLGDDAAFEGQPHHEDGAGEGVGEEADVGAPAARGDRRPVLQLVGAPSALGVRGAPLPPLEPLALPPAPAGVETRLPVMPMPGADAGRYARQLAARVAATPPSQLPPLPQTLTAPVAAPNDAPSVEASAPLLDGPTADYRAALELVHARRLEQALAALTVFIERNPGHAHVEGARYWRAEVHYAQREYARALAEFDELVREAPAGRKTPEALLKIGLCHQRMGDLARAHLFFQRVVRQFPDTEAARAASRQDAS